MELRAPGALRREHDCSGFNCGEAVLDEWLRKRAWKNEQAGASRCYVVRAGESVAAYYALAAGGISRAVAPGALRRNMPDTVPVMILARLAVDRRWTGLGIGSALVRDAVLRTRQAAEIAGIRAVLAHALHDRAADFYKGLGFIASPVDSLVLLLPLHLVPTAS